MLDWNDLKFLRAVGEAGSASAAARALAVDKATVSRRIAALERSLGTRVLDRRASGWAFTAAGARVAEVAGRIDLHLAELLADLGGEGGLRARVRLSVPQWFCNAVLLPHLGELRERAHWLDLNISTSSRMLNLAEREAEVGLRNIRPSRGEFVVRKAGELGSTLYASRRFLAGRKPISAPADLTGIPVIGYGDRLSYVPGFAWLEAMRDRLGPVLRVGDAQSIAAAVAGDLGAAVLPCLLGDRDDDLVRLFGAVETETIWLVAPTELARTRAVHTVMTFVADVFRRNAAALRGAQAPGG